MTPCGESRTVSRPRWSGLGRARGCGGRGSSSRCARGGRGGVKAACPPGEGGPCARVSTPRWSSPGQPRRLASGQQMRDAPAGRHAADSRAKGMMVVLSHHQQVHVLKQNTVNMQQNTPPQGPSLRDCLRSHPAPQRRERSPELVRAVVRVARSLAQVAAAPLFAHALLRAPRRGRARFAVSAAGQHGACASPACSRLCACGAAAVPLAVDRHLNQFWFPGIFEQCCLPHGPPRLRAAAGCRRARRGADARSCRSRAGACLTLEDFASQGCCRVRSDIREPRSPVLASAGHPSDAGASPPGGLSVRLLGDQESRTSGPWPLANSLTWPSLPIFC